MSVTGRAQRRRVVALRAIAIAAWAIAIANCGVGDEGPDLSGSAGDCDGDSEGFGACSADFRVRFECRGGSWTEVEDCGALGLFCANLECVDPCEGATAGRVCLANVLFGCDGGTHLVEDCWASDANCYAEVLVCHPLPLPECPAGPDSCPTITCDGEPSNSRVAHVDDFNGTCHCLTEGWSGSPACE